MQIVAATIAVLALDSCHSMDISTFCSERLPVWKSETEIALQDISEDRYPASDTSQASRLAAELPAIVEADRGRWTEWAQSQLIEAQRLEDLVPHRPEAKLLRETAIDWTEFYGYAAQGNVLRMRKLLRDIDSKRREIASVACPSAK